MTTQLVPLPGGGCDGCPPEFFAPHVWWLADADNQLPFTQWLRTQVLVVQVPESEPERE